MKNYTDLEIMLREAEARRRDEDRLLRVVCVFAMALGVAMFLFGVATCLLGCAAGEVKREPCAPGEVRCTGELVCRGGAWYYEPGVCDDAASFPDAGADSPPDVPADSPFDALKKDAPLDALLLDEPDCLDGSTSCDDAGRPLYCVAGEWQTPTWLSCDGGREGRVLPAL